MTIVQAQREQIIKLRQEIIAVTKTLASTMEDNRILRSVCEKYIDQAEVHCCAVDVLKATISVLSEKKNTATAAYDVISDIVCGVR